MEVNGFKLREAIVEQSVNKNRPFDEWKLGHRDTSTEWAQCVCGQSIKEKCWVINVETGTQLVIGNHCIRFFGEKPYCMECKIYPTTTTTATLCKHCRKKKTKPTYELTVGKHQGKSYRQVFEEDIEYCIYIRKEGGGDPHFCAWLRRSYELGRLV